MDVVLPTCPLPRSLSELPAAAPRLLLYRMNRLSQIVLFSRNLDASKTFYTEVFRFSILRLSENYVEFDVHRGGVPLAIKAASM